LGGCAGKEPLGLKGYSQTGLRGPARTGRQGGVWGYDEEGDVGWGETAVLREVLGRLVGSETNGFGAVLRLRKTRKSWAIRNNLSVGEALWRLKLC